MNISNARKHALHGQFSITWKLATLELRVHENPRAKRHGKHHTPPAANLTESYPP